MKRRGVVYQLGIFATQWALMVLGFGILTRIVVPLRLVSFNVFLGSYFDAGVKALLALLLSVIWLFIWDRQVRLYFYGRRG